MLLCKLIAFHHATSCRSNNCAIFSSLRFAISHRRYRRRRLQPRGKSSGVERNEGDDEEAGDAAGGRRWIDRIFQSRRKPIRQTPCPSATTPSATPATVFEFQRVELGRKPSEPASERARRTSTEPGLCASRRTASGVSGLPEDFSVIAAHTTPAR